MKGCDPWIQLNIKSTRYIFAIAIRLRELELAVNRYY